MKDKALGAFIGLAVGDAIGAPVEFLKRDTFEPVTGMRSGGYFKLRAGDWTDDTAMALALAHSVLAKGDVDPRDIMDRFVDWIRNANYTHTNIGIGLGATVKRALQRYSNDVPWNPFFGNPLAGSTEPVESGNGSIMRLAPVPIFFHDDIEMARAKSIEHSRTTHASDLVLTAVTTLSDIIVNNIQGKGYQCPMEIFSKARDDIHSTGFVVHTLEAAQWAVGQTDNFKDAVLLAANLGVDADTVAAVAGQIAGSLYGLSSIPTEWIEQLAWRDHLMDVATRLFERTVGEVPHPHKPRLVTCNNCETVHVLEGNVPSGRDPTKCSKCGNPTTNFRISAPGDYMNVTAPIEPILIPNFEELSFS